MARTLTVLVLGRLYRVLNSPERLFDDSGARCKALTDHDQAVIWLDPKVHRADREQVLLTAAALAWRSRLRETPVVD